MAVLTADRKTERKQGIIFALPVAATARIYSGAMVSADANGYMVPASDTAGESFVGVSRKESDNTNGANGGKTAEGYMVGLFEMNSAGLTQANLAKDVYVVDDNTVGDGIVAQPVNITGVVVNRTALTKGGTKSLAFIAAGTTIAYGGGTAVTVSTNGSYTLTATDGSTVEVVVTSASLPVADQSDNIQMRHLKAGRVIEYISASSVFIDISTAARS